MASREKHKERSQRSHHHRGTGVTAMTTPSIRKTDARRKIKTLRGNKNG